MILWQANHGREFERKLRRALDAGARARRLLPAGDRAGDRPEETDTLKRWRG